LLIRRKIPNIIKITGTKIVSNKKGATSKPAIAPIIPNGNSTTRTIKVDRNTANILIGNVKRNIPVFNKTENIFKKTTTNARINNRLSISIYFLPLNFFCKFTNLFGKRCILINLE